MTQQNMLEIAELIAEWIPELSANEKAYLYQELSKRNNGLFSLDVEAIRTGDSDRKLRLVSNIIGLLSTKKDFTIALKIAKKGEHIPRTCNKAINFHFFYMQMIRIFYKMRNELPEALETTIEYCKRQIEISPKVAVEMKSQYKDGLPNHTGYEQLAIIYEKKGEYDLALELCHKAYLDGWGEGVTNPVSKQNWEKRIEKIQAKKNKAGKNISPNEHHEENPKNTLDLNSDILKVPCPNCKAVLNVPSKYAGIRGTCKHCNSFLTIPDTGKKHSDTVR